jgi:diguanylate cyclase (GGDEF)-like protein/PAS domain S-box-containing protein
MRASRAQPVHGEETRQDGAAAARAVFDRMPDAVVTVDLDGRIESVNPAVQRLFGYAPRDLIGRPFATLVAPDDAVTSFLIGSDGVEVEGNVGRDFELPLGTELTGLRHDGTTFPLELSVDHLQLGAHTLATIVARDVTERRIFEQRLAHLGAHDALTGLANRTLFLDRVGHALDAATGVGHPLAILYCDLDRFKVVNDSLGHGVGDALLQAVAHRIHQAVRGTDTVARLGGDEFAVLADELTDPADAVIVAKKVAAALREPIEIEGHRLHITASIGIAVWTPGDDVCAPESLMRDADVAMYRSKANGASGHELFDEELRHMAVRRLETESALRRSLGLHQFQVHFQPEISLTDGQVVGCEALVRWAHPVDGLVSPAAFLPVAEETGLIVPIGVDVLSQACAEASTWQANGRGDVPTIWVNVSARQLADPGLLRVVRSAIDKWLPSSEALGLEITETDVVPDDDRSRRNVAALKDLGVRIAIDDFGTGFSSLAYLWRFPADVIKIDQSFVARLDDDPDAAVLVRAMIEMAHSLGKTIVAEGVETVEQPDSLRGLGCDTAQGYLLHRPMPASELAPLLR